MCWLRGLGLSVGHSGLVLFEERDSWGEVESIMYPFRPLPYLVVSLRGHDEESSAREEATGSRTQSTDSLSGSRGRRKHPQKLTKAHSASNGLRIAEDEPVAVYYRPRTFEELEDVA